MSIGALKGSRRPSNIVKHILRNRYCDTKWRTPYCWLYRVSPTSWDSNAPNFNNYPANMKHCTHCGTTKGKFTRYATNKKKTARYFHCRACNAKRARDYRKTKEGKEAYYQANKKQNTLHPEKLRARAAIAYHIKTGHITRPNLCSVCKQKKKLDAHHICGYGKGKELLVKWLCRQCHPETHRLSCKEK